MIAIAFTIDFGLGATWASYQDIGGRHVASVLGVGNMCGNLGAAIFARLIGYLADQDQWNYVFWISAGAMALRRLRLAAVRRLAAGGAGRRLRV